MSTAKKYLLAAGTLVLFCAVALLLRPFKIESDFFSLLPENRRDPVARETFRSLVENSAGIVHVIFLAETEENAIAAAKNFSAQLPQEDFRQNGFSAENAEALREFFRPFRFQLLGETQREWLRAENFSALKENAIAEIYSPVSARVFPLKEDPFGFATKFFSENPLLKSPFRVRDGIFCGNADGKFAAYLPLQIENPGKLSALREKMGKLRALREKIASPETEILFSGIPVHTDVSATRSLREINILSGASLTILLAIFALTFRSLKQFFITAGTLVSAIGIAAVAVNLLFGEIHVLVLVFGCSLIGIAVDYILHVLVAGKMTRALKRSLLMSAGTTALAFCVFFFSGIAVLAQIAAFCLVGIAFVLACVIFPLAEIPKLRAREISPRAQSISQKISAAAKRAGTPLLFAAPLIVAGGIFAVFTGKFSDDIRGIYVPPDELLRAEKIFVELSGQEPTAETLVLCGNDEQEVLRRQQALAELLPGEKRCIAQLIPSAETQRENFFAAKKLLLSADENFPIRFDARAFPREFVPLSPSALCDEKVLQLANLLFRKSGENFFAPIFIRGKIADVSALEKLCEKFGAHRVNSVESISAQLSACRVRLSVLLGIAILCFSGIFAARYGVFRATKMLVPPLCALSFVLGLLAFCGNAISIFHLLAFFLILGFGVDYVIFSAENRERGKARLSILLSCLTTLSAFGLLAFSEFPVLHEIGLSAATGIFSVFVFSEMLAGKISGETSENSRASETANADKATRA